jgi:predicted dehydrogenase
VIDLHTADGQAIPQSAIRNPQSDMRFGLLGTHPDGVAMACALVESGRHQLVAYTSAGELPEHVRRRLGHGLCPEVAGSEAFAAPEHIPQRLGAGPRRLHDLEEMLADPEIEAVIVAGTPANRAVQLRRAMQSERHVLCVHPPDDSPDIGYEATLLQGDTKCILLPLLTGPLHPAIVRLAQMARSGMRPLVELKLIELEVWSPADVYLNADQPGQRLSFPGWDVLRRLGGEIVEVSALGPREELEPAQPLLILGRFESGALFQVTLIPYQQEPRWRVTATGSHGRAELSFPLGWAGAAFLSWRGPDGEWHEDAHDAWDPWPAMVEVFEAALASRATEVTWQDAVRCLELDDAARRSVERRRSSTLEYQEVSEEVGFKGTMTLVGCGILWLVILLVVLANWFPKLMWVVVPLLLLFLGLQLFRWIIPRGRGAEPQRQGKQ